MIDEAKWNITTNSVENQVDSMLAVLEEAGADDQLKAAVDQVYRPYAQWLFAARENNVAPIDAHTTALHLINGMILETMARLGTRHGDGKKTSPREWVEDFILELIANLNADLEKIEGSSGPH